MKTVNKERYSRNLGVKDFTIEMQYKLQSSSVLVVGAGGLGSVVLSYLSAVGVGNLGIVEFDVVSESNLQRQILYNENDLGRLKGEVACERISLKNYLCETTLYSDKLTAENSNAIIKGYDLIVDCTDNYAARYVIDSASRSLSIPFIYGSAEQLTGQISTFNYKGGRSYSDLYPEPPKSDNLILGVLSPIPGIIGSLQALEAVKILLELGDTLENKLLLFDGVTYQTLIFDI